jgi:hypothetical protein
MISLPSLAFLLSVSSLFLYPFTLWLVLSPFELSPPFKHLSYSVLAAIGLLVLCVLVFPERERDDGTALPIDIKTRTPTGTKGVISIPPSKGKKWLREFGEHTPSPIPDRFVEFFIKYRRGTKVPHNPSIESVFQEKQTVKKSTPHREIFPPTGILLRGSSYESLL